MPICTHSIFVYNTWRKEYVFSVFCQFLKYPWTQWKTAIFRRNSAMEALGHWRPLEGTSHVFIGDIPNWKSFVEDIPIEFSLFHLSNKTKCLSCSIYLYYWKRSDLSPICIYVCKSHLRWGQQSLSTINVCFRYF